MIYNEKNYDHIVNWNGNNFRKTECGTFNINFSYIQGKLRQSIITPEEHSRLIAKTDKFGGLYIYRDNIRILPYGNSDYDFLDIEKNRTKSASYYFFSFRRMFGVINITKKVNFQLKEKAGREGFIENKAYRQMREILKNLFIQLAADFFREGGGPKASFWLEKRDERDRFYRAIELRDKQAKVRKEKFQKSLDDFFNDVTRKNFENQVADFLLETEKNISSVSYITDSEEASRAIIDIESNARQKLNSLRQNAKIKEPRGFGMSKDLRKDWEAYISEFEVLNSNIYVKAENEIDELISVYTNRLNIEISKRKRLEQAVDNISIEARKATSAVGKETAIALSMTASKVKELASDLMISLEDKISAIKEQFSRLHFENSDDFDLVTERKRMEEEILQEKNRSTEILESVISQLEAISWQRGTDGYLITSSEMNDALTDELYDLRDRVQTDIELSQLGLAVGVIHHEFNSTVTSMRNSIKELKAWADVNDKLDNVYNNLRINFEHLDGYLGLFTPLNRRLNRQVENILANDINIFLLDLFKPRLERHNITLKHTQGFSKQSLKGYRSTFYPVFVNIVDNAIYWLKQKNTDGDRIIRLHADDSGFYISNNGPEILLKDKDRIFELGFTRKPEGRGMGLHISQEVLDGVNYTIIVDEPRDQSTVTFKIQPKNQG